MQAAPGRSATGALEPCPVLKLQQPYLLGAGTTRRLSRTLSMWCKGSVRKSTAPGLTGSTLCDPFQSRTTAGSGAHRWCGPLSRVARAPLLAHTPVPLKAAPRSCWRGFAWSFRSASGISATNASASVSLSRRCDHHTQAAVVCLHPHTSVDVRSVGACVERGVLASTMSQPLLESRSLKQEA